MKLLYYNQSLLRYNKISQINTLKLYKISQLNLFNKYKIQNTSLNVLFSAVLFGLNVGRFRSLDFNIRGIIFMTP